MRSDDAYDGLADLLRKRGGALLATAVLLTGGRASGEDLLQEALERLMRAWRRVDRDRSLRWIARRGRGGPASGRVRP